MIEQWVIYRDQPTERFVVRKWRIFPDDNGFDGAVWQCDSLDEAHATIAANVEATTDRPARDEPYWEPPDIDPVIHERY